MQDSLSIKQNKDGSYTIDWDPNDPNWNWLNGKTSSEITKIIQDAIEMEKENNLNEL